MFGEEVGVNGGQLGRESGRMQGYQKEKEKKDD